LWKLPRMRAPHVAYNTPSASAGIIRAPSGNAPSGDSAQQIARAI